MPRVLPIQIPPIVTYQYLAYPLSIIMSHNNLRNWYYNNYIQLCCANDKYSYDIMNFTFANSTFNYIDAFNYKMIDRYDNKMDIANYIVEQLYMNKYIYMILDEYYIQKTKVKRHFLHDILFVGYDENDKILNSIRYIEGTLGQFDVGIHMINDAFYSVKLKNDSKLDSY